ncbi:MAG: hypothetical protein FJ108_05765 [Deltaproteobacteria bacterium]|nr:hypothetical protein [Deltaproteobacteria bacterium]
MSCKTRIRIPVATLVALLPFLALCLPNLASAQTTSTTHALKLGVKGLVQDTGSTGLDAIGKFSASETSLFELCTGSAPTKTQGVFLVIDCDFPSNNRIVAAETSPVVTVLEVLGDLHLESDFAAEAESASAGLNKLVVPASLDLACTDLSLETSGVLTLKLSPISTGGPICPVSGSLGFSGKAIVEGEHVIIDLGSKL